MRATTLANTLDDLNSLMDWKARTAMQGLVSRDDLLDVAYGLDADEKKAWNNLVEDCLKAAQSDRKANTGTALHRFTERHDAGMLNRIPPKWDGHLEAYRLFKEREQVTTYKKYIECITAVPLLGAAGTMDRIVLHEGKPKIADLKTGSVEYKGLSISMQLAMYANGCGLWDADKEEWAPMPKDLDMEEGLVFHMPADLDEDQEPFVELIRVDLVKGWKAAQLAVEVRELRKDKELLIK